MPRSVLPILLTVLFAPLANGSSFFGVDCIKAMEVEASYAQVAAQFKAFFSQPDPVNKEELAKFLKENDILARPKFLGSMPLIQIEPGNQHQLNRIAKLAHENYRLNVYTGLNVPRSFPFYYASNEASYIGKIMGVVLDLNETVAAIQSPFRTTSYIRGVLMAAYLSNKNPKNYASNYRGMIQNTGISTFQNINLIEIPTTLEVLRSEILDLRTTVVDSLEELAESDPKRLMEKITSLTHSVQTLVRLSLYLGSFYQHLSESIRDTDLQLTPDGTVLHFKDEEVSGAEIRVLLSSYTPTILSLGQAKQKLKRRAMEQQKIIDAFDFLPPFFFEQLMEAPLDHTLDIDIVEALEVANSIFKSATAIERLRRRVLGLESW